jgi:hypothetical protein
MNLVIKNILAVVCGFVLGSVANMAILRASGSVIPAPKGVDISTMEGLKATMHLFEPKHFLFPFLAHAIGTFFGAFVAAFIAENRKILYALIVGVFFLVGGITNLVMLPSPLWFNVTDLVIAYIPMAYLAGKLNALF